LVISVGCRSLRRRLFATLEVKAIGGATSAIRTGDQTQSAIWWHDRRLTEWAMKRQLAATEYLSVLESARMFAGHRGAGGRPRRQPGHDR
jgi:hypothetical protein